MVRPLHLNRLPKAGRLRAIKFKRTTPGNFARLLIPNTASVKNDIVDRSHPWANKHPLSFTRDLPLHKGRFLTVNAFPKALLGQPERRYPERPPFMPAPKTPYGNDGKVENGRKKVNISLMNVIGKKTVHKSAVVRNRIKSRIKSAVGLLVTRDATVETVDGEERLVTNESDDGEKWVMQNWTYVFTPTLDVYRMPLTELLKSVQQALSEVNAKCRKLENVWRTETRKTSSTRRRSGLSVDKDAHPVSRNTRSNKRETNEGGRERSADPISRVKSFLNPYISNVEVLDDLLGPEAEDDEEELFRRTKPNFTPRMNTPHLIKARLPPRRVATEEEVKKDTVTEKGYRPPSVVEAMYSRKPILKPVGRQKEAPRTNRR